MGERAGMQNLGWHNFRHKMSAVMKLTRDSRALRGARSDPAQEDPRGAEQGCSAIEEDRK